MLYKFVGFGSVTEGDDLQPLANIEFECDIDVDPYIYMNKLLKELKFTSYLYTLYKIKE